MPPDPNSPRVGVVPLSIWTGLVCLIASTAYFLARTPALDEWDSVQFAQGVGGFNLWRHHPHPPGYPLYILAGWLGHHLLALDIPTALALASALGGGLFAAAWFALAADAFGLFVGTWCAVALGTLLITVMTATKVLTDAPAAGLLAWSLLLASRRQLIPAALAAALTVGVRPQTFPVLLLIVCLAAFRHDHPRRWLPALGVFLGGCLLWLLPTMALQSATPESGGNLLAYPAQLLSQWRWRLDQPKAFVGAATNGESFLSYRLEHHLLGIVLRGFGFPLGSIWGWVGLGVFVFGWSRYVSLFFRRSLPSLPANRTFWKLHAPWASLYVVIVFCCLPGDQRYYLPIQPLLILPAILGWGNPWPTTQGRWLVLAVPTATLLTTLPFVAENHCEPAPPVRMLGFLQNISPPAERPGVHLLLGDSFRHAQWYASGFSLWSTASLPPDALAHPNAVIYTDDPALVATAPNRWREVRSYRRSPLIYRKHSKVTLYRLTPDGGHQSPLSASP